MKKIYEAPEQEIFRLSSQECLTPSGEVTEEITGTDIFTEAYGDHFA